MTEQPSLVEDCKKVKKDGNNIEQRSQRVDEGASPSARHVGGIEAEYMYNRLEVERSTVESEWSSGIVCIGPDKIFRSPNR